MRNLTPSQVLFGIFLPLIAILVELSTGAQSMHLYNPLPTPLHFLLVLSVPVANYCARSYQTRWSHFLHGFALAAGLMYCIALSPLGLLLGLFLHFFIVGILVLTPVYSTYHLFRALLWPAPKDLWRGFACGAAVALLATAPAWQAVQWAGSGSTQPPAFRFPGFTQAVDLHCRSQNFPLEYRSAPDDSGPRRDACTPVYWLTGKTASPSGRELYLERSEMTADVYPENGIETIDWRMSIRTRSNFQQEAELFIELPSGATVTGASLWVEGVERPARFGSTQKVTQAYTEIARAQRRDPLLITQAGNNLIRALVFPVTDSAPRQMRIRLAAPTLGSARLPRIVDGNVSLIPPVVTITGATALQSRSQFPPEQDPEDANQATVITRAATALPTRVDVIVDGSAWMKPHATRLRQILESWSQQTSLQIHFTGASWEFTGGADNLPTLARVAASAPKDSTILWIHGPQPYKSDNLEQVNQLLASGRHIHPVRIESGPNVLLDLLRYYEVLEPIAQLDDQLASMLTERWTFTRQPATNDDLPARGAAKLWAATRPAATALRYQVVTAQVGAVVLEKDFQYDKYGLKARPDTKPVSGIPEPATWLIVATGLAALHLYRKKNSDTLRLKPYLRRQ